MRLSLKPKNKWVALPKLRCNVRLGATFMCQSGSYVILVPVMYRKKYRKTEMRPFNGLIPYVTGL